MEPDHGACDEGRHLPERQISAGRQGPERLCRHRLEHRRRSRPSLGERKIFGMVRYMSYKGCRAKFDVQAYIDRVKGGK